MKTSKLFTIDTELAERLSKIDNASALINQLLNEYFRVRADKTTMFEQKKAIITDLKKKHVILRRKLRSWRILTSLTSTISALFGCKKSGITENQQKSQSKNTRGGEISLHPWIIF